MVTKPKLLSVEVNGIPTALQSNARWAPWQAVWNTKREKYDKIPCRATPPEYRLSTAKPLQWASYDTALKALENSSNKFAGLGYCMTGAHGVVGIDLDHCIDNGIIAPWALEIVGKLNSYAEVSPSGTGLRVMGFGEVAQDWCNHDVGIEVYGGNEARFLTITGCSLAGFRRALSPLNPEVLATLQKQYAKERTKAEVIDLTMPDILDDLVLPSIDSLPLPAAAINFLCRGEFHSDRSGALHAAGVALYAAGLNDETVFSLLATNPHAMEVALDHRRQDHDRALLYLWREHCVKARRKASDIVAAADEFDIIEDSDIDGGTPEALRFKVVPAGEFSRGPSPEWIIKRVVPRADLVVLYGDSGAGKSFVALDMSVAIARGVEWRGNRTKQGRVVYIAAEGGGGFRKRLKAYENHHGVLLDELPFGIIHASPNFLQKSDVVEVSKAILVGGKADVIVVDTFAQVTPGANENGAEDVGKALAHCRALHRATGAVVILVHHSGKDATKGARGWSGMRAAADAEIEVCKVAGSRVIRISKQKDGDDSGEWGFDLEIVHVGVDEDGDVIDSCVVVEAEVPEITEVAQERRPPGKWEYLVLEVLGEFSLAQSTGIEIKEVVAECVRRAPMEEGWSRDRRKERVNKALTAVCDKGDIYWRDGDCIEVLK